MLLVPVRGSANDVMYRRHATSQTRRVGPNGNCSTCTDCYITEITTSTSAYIQYTVPAIFRTTRYRMSGIFRGGVWQIPRRETDRRELYRLQLTEDLLTVHAQVYCKKTIRTTSTAISRRVFRILTEPVPYTFVSVNRRNNEAAAPMHCHVGKYGKHVAKYRRICGYFYSVYDGRGEAQW